jgi:hypothetical protein
MYVRMANAPGGLVASVDDPLDITSFSLSIDPGVDLDAVRSLDGPVRLESDEQAWISSAWLLAQEPFASDFEARAGIERMLAYARTRGWVDDERGEIAAHVVRA